MRLAVPVKELGQDVPVEVLHDHGAWTVSALVKRQGARLVMAELRIKPRTKVTPAGGIVQRVIRTLPYATFGPFVEAIISREDPDGLARVFGGAFRKGQRSSSDRPRPRRQRGKDDLFYARLAQAYLAAIERGSRAPVKDMALAYRVTNSQARDMVHEARERKLLSRGQPGIRGGVLLPRAYALLFDMSAWLRAQG
jgi:hypothetical protein